MHSGPVSIGELASLPWGDCTVKALAWLNDNRDLRLVVQLGDGREVDFKFLWCDRLRVDLTFEERENFAPLSTEGRIEQMRGGRGRLSLAFGAQGSLSFEFESVQTYYK